MDSGLFKSYLIEERSYVSFVKREIHNLVHPHFESHRAGEIDIVVSEMCSNLIHHANSGELLYRLSRDEGKVVFELICIDSAKGIKDIGHSSTDGVSSRGTLGQGLGAISRMSNLSQLYTIPDWGTIVYSKFIEAGRHKSHADKTAAYCLNVAKPGEHVSGDGVAMRVLNDKVMVLAGDGLGHGIYAKEAVDKAIGVFNESMSYDPADIIREVNDGVKKTRGLVATVAVLDEERKQWEICGVGNISTRMYHGIEYRNYICNNGVVGMNIPGRLENTVIKMEKFQLLIFCSDGIKTNWDLSRYPSLLKYDPMIIASVIYKDYARKTDDMTVMIIKSM